MTDEVYTRLVFEIEGARSTQIQIEKMGQASDALRTSFAPVGKAATTAAKEIKAAFQNSPFKTLREDASRAFDTIQTKSAATQQKIAELNKQFRAVSSRVSSFGDVDSSLVALGGFAGALGGGGIAQGATFGADIFAAAEALPRLGVALQIVGEQAKGLGGVVGGVATAAGAATAGLGGTASALASVAAAAAPFALAVGGLFIAFSKFQEDSRQRQSVIEGIIAGRKGVGEILAGGGTSRTAQEAIQKEQNTIAAAQAAIDQANVDIATARAEAAKNFRALQGESVDLLSTAFNATAVMAALNDALKPLESEIAAQNAVIAESRTAVQGYTAALEGGAFAANDAAAREKQLVEARLLAEQTIIQNVARYAEAEKQLNAFGRGGTSDQLKARLEALGGDRAATERQLTVLKSLSEPTEEVTKRIADLEKELGILDYQLGALDRPIRRIIEARESEVKALERQKEALAGVVEAGIEAARALTSLGDLQKERQGVLGDRGREDARAKQIADLEGKIEAARETERESARSAAIDKVRKDAATAEKKAGDGYRDDVRRANEDFFASQLASLRAFRVAEGRINDDFALAQRRKLEDLNADLLDLAASRDVAGFIRRQREGETDLRRGAEDFGIDAQRRTEDFSAEREAARAARDARLSDLKEGLNRELEAQRATTDARLKQEEAAKQTQATQSAALEKALSDLRAKFYQEDFERRRQVEDSHYQERLNALAVNLRQQGGILATGFTQSLGLYGQFVAGAIQLTRQLISLPATPRQGGYQPLPVRNAEGGIYDRPTMGMLGERSGWIDYVIPGRKSEGFEQALDRVLGRRQLGGGGIVYNDQRNITIGDIASRGDVEAALRQDRFEMLEGLRMAVAGGNA